MKVVFLEDITGTGRAGEIKEVSKGYAKNFLLPRGLALIATPGVTKQVESRLERKKIEESVDREKLVELAQQIEGKEIHLKARLGGGERLFGSITAANVAEELGRAIGSVIDKKRIDIKKPFRQTGSYEVAVKLASDIRPKITLVIEEEENREIEPEKKVEKKQPKAKVKEKEEEPEPKQKVEKKQGKGKKKAKAEEEEKVKEEKKD